MDLRNDPLESIEGITRGGLPEDVVRYVVVRVGDHFAVQREEGFELVRVPVCPDDDEELGNQALQITRQIDVLIGNQIGMFSLYDLGFEQGLEAVGDPSA